MLLKKMIFAVLIVIGMNAYSNFNDLIGIASLKNRLDILTQGTLVSTGIQNRHLESGFRSGMLPEVHFNFARPLASKSR